MGPVRADPRGAWIGSKTPIAPPTSANPTLRRLLYAGVVTGAWAGILSLLVSLVGRAFGVDYDAVTPWVGDGVVTAVTSVALLVNPLAAGVIAALLSTLAVGRAQGGRLVFWGGTLIALASLAIPLGLQPTSVAWTTRIWLCLPHVITWFLVVPQLARIVADSEPGAHVDRND